MDRLCAANPTLWAVSRTMLRVARGARRAPKGWSVSIMLEECELPDTLQRVNLERGEQRNPAFLELSPNGRISAIRAGEVTVAESGASLRYPAERSGHFLPEEELGHWDVLQWGHW